MPDESLFRIDQLDGRGRCVVATCNVQAGTAILEDHAACSWNTDGNDLLNVLKAVNDAPDAEWMRIMDLTAQTKQSSADLDARIESLRSSLSDLPKADRQAFSSRRMKSTEEDSDELLNLFLRAQFNAHTEPSGVVSFFPLGAMLNHSCNPNTCYTFPDSGKIRFTIIRDIEVGEEVTASYLDNIQLMRTSQFRRESLCSTKGFWCNCERCMSAEGDLTRAVCCKDCNQARCCPVQLDPARGDLAGLVWKCLACQRQIPVDDACSIIEAEAKALAEWNAADAASWQSKATMSIHAKRALSTLGQAIDTLSHEHYITQLLRISVLELGDDGNIEPERYRVEALNLLEWLVKHFRKQVPIICTSLTIGPTAALFDMKRGELYPGLEVAMVLKLFEGLDVLATYKYGEEAAYTKALHKILKRYKRPCMADPCIKGLQSNGKQMLCGRCRCVFYCSRECQVADWKAGHKLACTKHQTHQQTSTRYHLNQS